MLWSGYTLEKRLNDLIFDENGNPSGKKSKIDCAAYTLTIGPQAFVTPDGPTKDPKGHTKFILDSNGSFKIPTGQFALLLTEEYVRVPKKAMAFISFKTRYKWMGLINVSGFHVDPGWNGRLIFSVFNAGPRDIPIARGDDFALIWYVDLDEEGNNPLYQKNIDKVQQKEITSSQLATLTGEVFSPMVIKNEMEELKTEIREVEKRVYIYMLITVIAAVIAIGHRYVYDVYINPYINPIQIKSEAESKPILEQNFIFDKNSEINKKQLPAKSTQ